MFGLGDYGKYASMGISWVLTTAVYLYGGYRGGEWLDARWQTKPIFLIVGILIGTAMSVMTLVKELLVLTDAQKSGERSDTGSKTARDSEKNNFPEGKGASDVEHDAEPGERGKKGRTQ